MGCSCKGSWLEVSCDSPLGLGCSQRVHPVFGAAGIAVEHLLQGADGENESRVAPFWMTL